MLLEIDVQREARSVSMPGKLSVRYMQTISIVPFSVVSVSKAQTGGYFKFSKGNESSTVQTEETGSNTQSHKTTLLEVD